MFRQLVTDRTIAQRALESAGPSGARLRDGWDSFNGRQIGRRRENIVWDERGPRSAFGQWRRHVATCFTAVTSTSICIRGFERPAEIIMAAVPRGGLQAGSAGGRANH